MESRWSNFRMTWCNRHWASKQRGGPLCNVYLELRTPKPCGSVVYSRGGHWTTTNLELSIIKPPPFPESTRNCWLCEQIAQISWGTQRINTSNHHGSSPGQSSLTTFGFPFPSLPFPPFPLFSFLFWYSVLSSMLDLPCTCYVGQTGLKLMILLSRP